MVGKTSDELFKREVYEAVKIGDVKTLQILFSKTDFHSIINQAFINDTFTTACYYSNLTVMDLLMTSYDLPIHPDICKKSVRSLVATLEYYRQMEIPIEKVLKAIDYLLSILTEKGCATIHSDNEYFFKTAYQQNELEILQHIIINHNLEKTKMVTQILDLDETSLTPQLNSLFKLRGLHKDLNNNLVENQVKKTLVKV